MKSEIERLNKALNIMKEHPNSAFTEGMRRVCRIFDNTIFIYSAVSSGKDSVFMTNCLLLELFYRRFVYNGLLEDSFKKEWEDIIGISHDREDFKFYGEGGRIGCMSMDYELTFNESRELKLRMEKEYATDFELIVPENLKNGLWHGRTESVKELGFDLRWIDDNSKCNPYEYERRYIEKITPDELSECYGKKGLWFWDCCFPISWQNMGSVTNSRYVSFDPDKRDLWVTTPPTDTDPYEEYVMTLENMYKDFMGLPSPVEILPAMSDQKLRVEFSKYLSRVIPDAIANGWPNKRYKKGEWV